MKLLLVQPAPFEHGRMGLENALWLSEPVALTSIAAMVKGRHEVRILDMRLEEDGVLARVLADFRPDVVGASCMTTDAYQAQAVCYAAKSILGDAVFTIVGGHHPTLAPEAHDIAAIDAVCIGEGEETFAELCDHLAAGGSRDDLGAIAGLAWRAASPTGTQQRRNPNRSQARSLDTFPLPARELISSYLGRYFFAAATPLASIQTSRGCAYDCNFCAIWEFYERKVRFLSAAAIVDRMEAVAEKFIFFLDDNFLSHRGRIEEFLAELERRKPGKFWMIQGRTDFIAQHPDLMKRMRDAGLCMVLSGYETNDEGTLAALKKDNLRENNLKAAALLRKLGIWTTGIFMTRPDFEAKDFEAMWAAIREMKISIPLVVIHTPLPGTQGWRAERHTLLTEDARFFDLLHAVQRTRLPREEFYRQYARWNQATMGSSRESLPLLFKRPRLTAALLKGVPTFVERLKSLRRVIEDPQSYLRDEADVIPREAGGARREEEIAAA
ncbi:MAG: radical SAM protein [Planctomycetes bacterium]|nr:radical SAM protein [Planctomycetota bacterium]